MDRSIRSLVFGCPRAFPPSLDSYRPLSARFGHFRVVVNDKRPEVPHAPRTSVAVRCRVLSRRVGGAAFHGSASATANRSTSAYVE